mgnify:CR=1 FL=1
MRFSWSKDNFFSSVAANYTDSYEDDVEGLRGRELDELDDLGVLNAEGTRQVSSWTTWRLNVGYDFAKTTISFNIDNLFDRNLPGVTTGTGTGSASYDNIGQLFYTTVSFKM